MSKLLLSIILAITLLMQSCITNNIGKEQEQQLQTQQLYIDRNAIIEKLKNEKLSGAFTSALISGVITPTDFDNFYNNLPMNPYLSFVVLNSPYSRSIYRIELIQRQFSQDTFQNNMNELCRLLQSYFSQNLNSTSCEPNIETTGIRLIFKAIDPIRKITYSTGGQPLYQDEILKLTQSTGAIIIN